MAFFSSLQQYVDTITARLIKPVRGVSGSEGVTNYDVLEALTDAGKRMQDTIEFVTETNSSTFIQASITQAQQQAVLATQEREAAAGLANTSGILKTQTENIRSEVQTIKTQLEQDVLDAALYKGVWNAASNTPTLTASPLANGSYYQVEVGGTQGITGSSVMFDAGDFLKSNGTAWQRIPRSSQALLNLNGTKIADSGAMPGVYVPEVQYLHPRGIGEMLGNGTYFATTTYGQGFYEQMAETVAFNRVRLPLSVTSAGIVTVRVYKSATQQNSPASMTLLGEVVIASGAFNVSETEYQTVDFPSILRVKAGEYLTFLAITDTGNRLKAKRWTSDAGAAPYRHKFLYLENVSNWTTAWKESGTGSGFWQAGFEVSLNAPSTTAKANETRLKELEGFSFEKTTGRINTHTPFVPYAHPRGDAEIAGSTTFLGGDTYGFGFYESLPQGAAFNRIEAGIRSTLDGQVTLKVFTSKTFTSNIPSMTPLQTKVYAPGTFNTATGVAIFDLDDHCLIPAGAYVYIFFHSTTLSDLRVSMWGSDTTSPARHSFLFATVTSQGDPATHWAKSWNTSTTSSGFWQAGFRLTNIQDRTLYNKAMGAISADGNGKVKNTYLEAVSYNHPRGDAELLGNAGYTSGTTTALGAAVQLTEDTVFNIAEIGIRVLKTCNLTAKVFKGSTFTGFLSTLTELASLTFPSSDVMANFDSASLQKIILPTPIKVNSGQWVYVVLASDVAGALEIRYWNTDTTSPARGRFLHTTNASPFASNMSVSSAVFFSAALKLTVGDPAREKRLLVLEKKVNNPRLVLPSKIHFTVGREKSLYYDTLVFGKDIGYNSPADWNVVVSCAKGTSRHRYWRFTPLVGDVGEHSLVINVYDNQGILVASKSATIVVSAAEKPGVELGVAMIGDSTVAPSDVRAAMNEAFAAIATGVTPVFVGTQGSNPTRSEGWGGSKWEGHVQQTMVITGGSRTNSLWNPNTGQIDIAYYKSTVIGYANSIKVADIRLGINDLRGTLRNEAHFQTLMGYAKTLVDAWLAHDPATRVIVQLPLSDMNVNWGGDKFTYRANMRRLWEYIIETFDNGAYNARVFVGDVGLCVDRYYGYQITTAAAGNRYTETETLHNDNVHPRSQGYKEAGDAAFPTILWAARL